MNSPPPNLDSDPFQPLPDAKPDAAPSWVKLWWKRVPRQAWVSLLMLGLALLFKTTQWIVYRCEHVFSHDAIASYPRCCWARHW